MENFDKFYNRSLNRLRERQKELNCLYAVFELLSQKGMKKDHVFNELIEIIPAGWQHTTICEVKIIFRGEVFKSDDFIETEWCHSSEIVVGESVSGRITICYTQLINSGEKNPFLPEEIKLLKTITDKVGEYFFYQQLKETVEFLETPATGKLSDNKEVEIFSEDADAHWKWRLSMSNKIAEKIDLKKFGAKAIYLIGSTKNATAGPASDIDLLIHFCGDSHQQENLASWMEGWSLCLSELNYIRTGYETDGLIDLHVITDSDVSNRSSFAVMIDRVDDRARILKSLEQ